MPSAAHFSEIPGGGSGRGSAGGDPHSEHHEQRDRKHDRDLQCAAAVVGAICQIRSIQSMPASFRVGSLVRRLDGIRVVALAAVDQRVNLPVMLRVLLARGRQW